MQNVFQELLDDAERELGSIRLRKAEIDGLERTASERVAHLRALVELDAGTPTTPAVAETGRPIRAEDVAAEVLSELGAAHYQSIWDEVAKRGASISSENPAAALLTRMSRDPRFAKTAKRGVYRLADAGDSPLTATPKKRRASRRGRRTTRAKVNPS